MTEEDYRNILSQKWGEVLHTVEQGVKETNQEISRKTTVLKNLVDSLGENEVIEMNDNWHRLNQTDDKTYPKSGEYYLAVCVKPDGRGLGEYYRDVVYYDCMCGFDNKDSIVLYWKEVDWPEDYFLVKQ